MADAGASRTSLLLNLRTEAPASAKARGLSAIPMRPSSPLTSASIPTDLEPVKPAQWSALQL